ncbi:MAG: glycosyltransferase [Chloroflexi bacterium]|nr:glycosyltransferase [Chloroflexota bacterium]
MSPESPLVSVIIPNYNHARFLGDAIRSVLNQTYRPVEIIVVDDGSTDDSAKVAAAFGDQIRYIYQTNAGLSAARNTGLRASKGELIGVLDADDMYEPNFLETLVAALQADPAADGVYCGYRFVDEADNPLPQIENRPVSPADLYTALLDGNFFVPESVFLRRRVYDEVGFFDESLRACEDWDVWLRAAKKFRLIHSPHILTRHRVLAGSMSTDPLRMLTARLAVLKKHVGAEPASAGDSLLHRAYGRAYLGSCVEYLQYGHPQRSYECFQKMANICPSLLLEVDTYYQLGCGDQPKGHMGDLASLNVRRNSLPLLGMMERLFADASTAHEVKRLQRAARARMFHSLGLLAYGTREFDLARRFFRRAVQNDFTRLFAPSLLSRWVKSLLGERLLERLKALRRR